MDRIDDHNNGSRRELHLYPVANPKDSTSNDSDDSSIHLDFHDSDKDSSKSKVTLASLSTSTSSSVPVVHTKEFMDISSLSSGSSDISDIHLSDDDDLSISDRNRASFFIDSSRMSLSMSSDDDDDDDNMPCICIFENPADVALYTDWDSGLSHSSVEVQQEDTESWTNNSTDMPELEIGRIGFPHRALRLMECEICLEMSYLRRRVCCDFQACNKCLLTYLTGKVMDGRVQIECLNDRCNSLICQAEIRNRLGMEMRDKFEKFLINANKDPHIKTCPTCSLPYEIEPERLKISKKKLKLGVQVHCPQCRLAWCFRCQAPFHSNMTCKKFKNGDQMLKRWAKEVSFGQANAQKCPKCKIFVQKVDGCDHMKCSQCETNFCYRCGDRYISVKFFGSHWNRFSLFGCKYRLMPEKTGLRRLIRGSHFVGRMLGAVVFAALGVAAGAVLVAGSVVILPGYGIIRLRRRMWAAKQRKKFHCQKMRMIGLAEKSRAQLDRQFQGGNLATVVEESETETLEPIADPQQVQVLVHRTEGREELSFAEETRECNIFVNSYADDVVTESNLNSACPVPTDGCSDEGGEIVARMDATDSSAEGGRCMKKKVPLRKMSTSEKDKDKKLMGASAVVDNDDDNAGDTEAISVKSTSREVGVCEVVEDVSRMKGCGGNNSDKDNKQDTTLVRKKRRSSHSDLKMVQDLSGKFSDSINLNPPPTPPTAKTEERLDENIEVTLLSSDGNTPADGQLRKHSLSKLKSHLDDKMLKTKILKDTDVLPASEKIDGENGGKGCFGNIFSVTKRSPSGVTTGNSINTNDDAVLRLDKIVNKEKMSSSSLTNKKAATWEKCRRGKVVEIEAVTKTSVVDSVINDCNYSNHFPLLLHKSASSLSSIIGFNFGVDDSDAKKDYDVAVTRDEEEEEGNDDGDNSSNSLDLVLADGDYYNGGKHRDESEDNESLSSLILEGEARNEEIATQRLSNQHECIAQVSVTTHL